MSRVIIDVPQDWIPPVAPSDRKWVTLSADDQALLESFMLEGDDRGGGDDPHDRVYLRPDGSTSFLVDAAVAEEAFRREPGASSISEAISRILRWQAGWRRGL